MAKKTSARTISIQYDDIQISKSLKKLSKKELIEITNILKNKTLTQKILKDISVVDNDTKEITEEIIENNSIDTLISIIMEGKLADEFAFWQTFVGGARSGTIPQYVALHILQTINEKYDLEVDDWSEDEEQLPFITDLLDTTNWTDMAAAIPTLLQTAAKITKENLSMDETKHKYCINEVDYAIGSLKERIAQDIELLKSVLENNPDIKKLFLYIKKTYPLKAFEDIKI